MAADFGLWELNFPSSRAVNDEDDEEDTQITPEEEKELYPNILCASSFLELQNSSKKIPCSLLVFGTGEVSTTFLHAHFLCGKNSETIAVITGQKTEKDFDSVVKNVSTARLCALHRLRNNNDVLFCQIPTHVEQDQAFYWSKKLFETLSPSKVIILTSSPACEYSSSEPWELKSDFLKMMKTKPWTDECKDVGCGYVQTPNTIKGLPAAIMSYCQVYGKKAALFACYTESAHVDVQAVEAFKALLSLKELSTLQKAPSEETAKVLKTLGTGSQAYNNLYM